MAILLEWQAKKLKVTVELKEERIKSFFNTTLHCKQACNLPKYVLKESKKVIYFEVFETIWTGVRTFQNGHPTPLLFLCFPLSFTYHSLQCPPVSFFVALFFLPRILAFFPALWGFYSQVYDHFLTNAHIYAHKKAHIYSLQTSIRIWGHRKSSYKRHRIIPSAKKSFMYDGAEK